MNRIKHARAHVAHWNHTERILRMQVMNDEISFGINRGKERERETERELRIVGDTS